MFRAAGSGKVPTCIAQSYPNTSAIMNSTNTSGDTSFVQLATITVPGGTMGLNSLLRIEVDWGYSNTVSNKVPTVKWGGAPISQPTVTGTTTNGRTGLIRIANAGSLSLQRIQNNDNYGSANRGTDRTSDTSSDVIILLGGAWSAAVSGEFISLIGYSIWHYPG